MKDAFDRLGPVLREIRIERRLNQPEFADRTGINKARISSYELGKQPPSLATLAKLLEGLGVGPAELGSRLEEYASEGGEGPIALRQGGRRPAAGPTIDREVGHSVAGFFEALAELIRAALKPQPPAAEPASENEPEHPVEETHDGGDR